MDNKDIKFIHNVSKGSRYNQIYIPEEYRKVFEVGDIVEVKLIKKNKDLFFSNKDIKLSNFKENLIKNIFDFFSKYKEIKQIFIFGSFLTKKIDYNDIDVMVLTDKERDEEFDKKIFENLSEEFNLKFHVISTTESRLIESLKFSPMTRSMLYYFVSDKEFYMSKEIKIDINHIKHLLMFPEDLLEVSLDDGKVYYDVLKKLVVVEYFLKRKEIAPDRIDTLLEKIIDIEKIKFIKSNGSVSGAIKNEIERVIREKIKLIYQYLKDEQKR